MYYFLDGRAKTAKMVRAMLRERDGERCWVCGKQTYEGDNGPEQATVDHVLERAFGGLDELDNLKLAHRSCNYLRSNDIEGAVSRFWTPGLVRLVEVVCAMVAGPTPP